MTTRPATPSRLRLEILELAGEMRANGTLDEADFRKITLRDTTGPSPSADPLTAEEIRALREAAHMSQAVFARYLNVTTGHLSQLERGIKRPTGPALALLNVIRRKGIGVVM